MSKITVYMKFDQNILTKKEKIFLKEIAEISCSDKNIENVVTWWSEVAEHYQDKSLIPSPATIK